MSLPPVHDLNVLNESQRQWRIWLIDRQVPAIGHDMPNELGSWLKHRVKKGISEQGGAAQQVLNGCGVSISGLRIQWNAQRTAQLSIKARM